MTAASDFDTYLSDVENSNSYKKWAHDNPKVELHKWLAFSEDLKSGKSPVVPKMATLFGKSLVDAGILFIDAQGNVSPTPVPPTPPPPPVPTPPPTPAPSGINTFDYGLALKRRNADMKPTREKHCSTISQLTAAWADIKPGDGIFGHGLRNDGQVALTGKSISDRAFVDLSDDCILNMTGNPALGSMWFAYNTNISLYGGRYTGAQVITYDLVNADVMDLLLQKLVAGGLTVFGIKNAVRNCIFRVRVEDSSYGCHPVAGGSYFITDTVKAEDPHDEDGTGIHGSNLGDSHMWVEDSKFILDFENVWTGAAIELSNLRRGSLGTGVEIWVRAKGLHQPAKVQVAGNGLQLWGSPSMITDSLTVHALEVYDAQGRAVEADDQEGPFGGVVIEKAVATNVCQNPKLKGADPYRKAAGITYKDVK
jgi:hypothetical protein